MKSLLRLSSILDSSGHYILSDKLFRIAQKVLSPEEFMKNDNVPERRLSDQELKNQVYDTVRTLNRNRFKNRKDINVYESNSPESFVNNLFDYGQKYNFENLALAFENYANNGATFNGVKLNRVPELVELFNRIFSSGEMLTRDIVKNELISLMKEKSASENSNILSSNSASNFVDNLFEFGYKNNLSSLTDSFDDYADAGAIFDGVSIKQHPALRLLYEVVKRKNKMISKDELKNDLSRLLSGDRNILMENPSK